MHCLIVRGLGGAFVRRWAPDTLLNGRNFEDQPLRNGDRLSIGPIELDVVSIGATSCNNSEASELSGSAGYSRSGSDRRPDSSKDSPPAMFDSKNITQPEVNQAIAAEWAILAEQRRQFETRCAEIENSHRETEARLARQRHEIELNEARLEQMRSTLEQRSLQIDRETESLASQWNELRVAQTELASQRERFAAECAAVERRLTEQAQELARQREQFEVERETLRKLARCGQSNHSGGSAASNEEELAHYDRNALQFSSLGETDSPQNRTCTMGSYPDESAATDNSACLTPGNNSVQTATEESVGDRSSRVEEILRRFGRTSTPECSSSGSASTDFIAGPVREADADSIDERDSIPASTPRGLARYGMEDTEGESESDGELRPDDVTPPTTAASSANNKNSDSTSCRPEVAHAETGGDDDIHAYMAELLRRLGRSPEAGQPQTSMEASRRPKVEEVERSPRASDTQRATSWSDTEEPAEPRRTPLSSLEPRATAPEKNIDLDAMRELANLSTRAAIAQHSWRRLWQTLRSRLAAVAALLIIGAVLLWFHHAGRPNAVAFYSGWCTLTIAGAMLLHCITLAVGLWRSNGGPESQDRTNSAQAKDAHADDEKNIDLPPEVVSACDSTTEDSSSLPAEHPATNSCSLP